MFRLNVTYSCVLHNIKKEVACQFSLCLTAVSFGGAGVAYKDLGYQPLQFWYILKIWPLRLIDMCFMLRSLNVYGDDDNCGGK